jgi:hypothetical protein
MADTLPTGANPGAAAPGVIPVPTGTVAAVADAVTAAVGAFKDVQDSMNSGDMKTAVERANFAAFQAQLVQAQVACAADPTNQAKEDYLNKLTG